MYHRDRVRVFHRGQPAAIKMLDRTDRDLPAVGIGDCSDAKRTDFPISEIFRLV